MLTRYLSPWAALGLAFGYAVGWGAFVMPGKSFLPGAGPIGTVIGVLIGGVVMTIVAWNYHTLVRRRACSGGAYNYIQDAFGADFSFLGAWSLILAYLAVLWANATALSLISRHALGDLLHFGFHYQVAGFDIYLAEAAFCVAVMAAIGLLCFFRKRMAARTNLALSALFVIGVLLLFGVAALRNPQGLAALTPAFSPLDKGGPGFQVLLILSMMPWAFVGFEAISNSSAEFRFNTHRTFGILTVAVIIISLVYIMLALLPVLSLPDGFSEWPQYIAAFGKMNGPDTLPTQGAAIRILGAAGRPLFFVLMLCGVLTGILCGFIATSRLLHGLAEDGVISPWFGRLDRDGNPRNAILAVLGGSLAVPFFGRTAMGWPIDVSSIGAAIVYCLVSAAAFKFAREHKDRLTQITGVSGGALSVVFCLLLLVPNYLSGTTLTAESYLVMALWCLLGFVVYRRMFKHNRARFGHAPVVWIGVLVLIFFSTIMWCRQMTKGGINETAHRITDFYEERRSHFLGMNLSDAAVEREHRFMSDRIAELNVKMLEYDFVEIGMLAFALVLIFSLYRTLQYREKVMEVAKVKAEQSNRAKSGFLSNMSHDIRTPMNAIIGYTELAKRAGVTETMLRDYLRKIEASSHHLLALINDVLEMSRIESGKMELEPTAIDLAALLNEVHDMFATQTAVKKVAFEVDASRLVHRCVMCDKNRLNRVLLNLISNAIKFTPEGGRITLTIQQLGDTDSHEGLYELRVKDTGIGMSQKFAARVFEAFEREKTSTVSGIQGTGLGMSITKSIVDLMKGEISVKTEQGKGTEFIICLALPFAAEGAVDDAANVTAAATQPTVDFSSRRLLLVEDNEVNREIAAAILSDAGFALDLAENGQEAVEKVAQGGVGFYDAVLMDVQMPVMDGYEATRTIRAMDIPGLSNIPILALSANAFESDVKDALAAGMNAHVAKPLKIPELMSKLAELIGERGTGNGERGMGNGESAGGGSKPENRNAEPETASHQPPTTNYQLPTTNLFATLKEIGCDVERARDAMGGDSAFYLKMLQKLSANTALTRVRGALEAQDATAVFAASHELKGMYAYLGLTPLYELCSEIVEIARPGGLDGIAEPLEQLEAMQDEIVSLVKENQTEGRK